MTSFRTIYFYFNHPILKFLNESYSTLVVTVSCMLVSFVQTFQYLFLFQIDPFEGVKTEFHCINKPKYIFHFRLSKPPVFAHLIVDIFFIRSSYSWKKKRHRGERCPKSYDRGRALASWLTTGNAPRTHSPRLIAKKKYIYIYYDDREVTSREFVTAGHVVWRITYVAREIFDFRSLSTRYRYYVYCCR